MRTLKRGSLAILACAWGCLGPITPPGVIGSGTEGGSTEEGTANSASSASSDGTETATATSGEESSGVPPMSTTGAETGTEPPELVRVDHEREFRGVWIATVFNIDFPPQPGLTTDAQQQTLLGLLPLGNLLP